MTTAVLRRCVLSCMVVSFAASAPALAQFPGTLTAGSRVRVAVADSVRQLPFGPQVQRISGTVASTAPDTLYLTMSNIQGTLAVPRSSVRTLWESRGVPTRTESAVTNGVLFALLGAGYAYLVNWMSDQRAYGSPRDAALGGAGVGLAFGVALGAARPVERWRRVRLGR